MITHLLRAARTLLRSPAYTVAAVATFAIVKLLGFATALRPTPKDEGLGLDFTQHGEEAYSRGEGAILLLDRRSE